LTRDYLSTFFEPEPTQTEVSVSYIRAGREAVFYYDPSEKTIDSFSLNLKNYAGFYENDFALPVFIIKDARTCHFRFRFAGFLDTIVLPKAVEAACKEIGIPDPAAGAEGTFIIQYE
ncbi:MAG: hypothetical protein FWE62_06135, partial [Firmicutes bacterium]|nr:hypothetical protein [Bacillota bacterium]